MDANFCVAALEEAIGRRGKPGLFNTDQGSQFTSFAFTNTLREADIRHLDGWPWPLDGQCLHRLRWSLKYECVFLTAFETGSEARTGIGRHSTFSGRTPDEVYARQESEEKLAA
jgi:putative transposase